MDSRTARYTQTVSPRWLFELTRTAGYAKCQQREPQVKPPPPMTHKENRREAKRLSAGKRSKVRAGRFLWQGSVGGTVTTRYVAQSNRAKALRFVAQFWGLDSRESGRTRG